MLRALILGGSANVFDEAATALRLFEPDAVFVTNDMIAKWPGRVDYICSLHPEKVNDWIEARRKRCYPMGAEVWCHKKAGPRSCVYSGVDRTTDDWAGSSGLFAVKVALEEGFQKIVLAGVPLTVEGKHIVRSRAWTAAAAFHNGWKSRLKRLEPLVRSMSGWTQELLGAPTLEWLAHETPAN
jgi:hypothetical protein